MVKISNYRLDRVLYGDDKIIGTDAEGRVTKNFTLNDLSLFFQTNSENGVNLTGVHGRILDIENGNFVIDLYATNEQLETTKFSLEREIAAQNEAITTGYTTHVDGRLTSYATSTAVQTIVSESTRDLASAQSVTDLGVELREYTNGRLNSYSTTEATQQLITTATSNKAEASFVTNLASSLGETDDSGVLTISSTVANDILRTANTSEFATAESVENLKTSLVEQNEDGDIIGVSESVVNSVLSAENTAEFATAQSVTDLRSEVFIPDADGNTPLTSTIKENRETIATVDGKLQSRYALKLNSGNAIAGMSLLANGEDNTSEVKFAAESFKFQNGEGTLTPFSIDATNSKIQFTGDVVFGIDEYSDTKVQNYIATVGEIFTPDTTISGGQIETGLIKNSTYPHSAGHLGFATSGMAIDLDNGSLHSKNFYINSNGSATFKGNIEISSGNLTDAAGRTVASQTINLDPTSGAITLAHEGITGGDGIEADGEVVVDSIGITTSTAGIIKPTGDFYPYTPWTFGSNVGYSNVSAWFHGKASRTELYTSEEGVSYIAGAYFSAENTASEYTTSYTPSAAYGAVIKKARIEGEVRWMDEGTGGDSQSGSYQLESGYCGFYCTSITSGIRHVRLFADAHKWQVYDVMHPHRNGATRVYAPDVSSTVHADLGDGVHNDHRNNVLSVIVRGTDQYSYVDVVNRETIRFMWVGTHWRIVHFDRLH